MQFERLVEGIEGRAVAFDTPVGRFVLTRHGNVITCMCQLAERNLDGEAALTRRGAVEGMFVISPKLPPKEFGVWMDRLLVDDLGAHQESTVLVSASDMVLSSIG